MRLCVYGAASYKIDESYILAGEKLGEVMAKRGHSLVFGGGANGMMGAVARGVHKNGQEIVSIAPSFFDVDGRLFDKCTEYMYPKTMRERKQKMEDLSEGFIVTPGGMGTFDEFFEILTLKQLGQHNKPIVLLNTNGYFDKITDMIKEAVKRKFINENSLKIFKVVNTPEEAIDYIENYDGTETFNILELKDIKKD